MRAHNGSSRPQSVRGSAAEAFSRRTDVTSNDQRLSTVRATGDSTLEMDLERATQQVAAQQAQWRNSRDLGGMQPGRAEARRDGEPSEGEENQAISLLTFAQNEWRKVLDGTRGLEARRPMLPVTEAISNTFWGDDCPNHKDGYTFRLYAQNVNGLPLDRRGGQFDTLCQAIKEVQAYVFLGQEHNLDSTQYQVESILHETSKQHWERYRLNIATTPISCNSMYKPGGTFMLAAGNATGRITSQEQDMWGRWVCQTVQGAQGRTITIVSAYQVVSDLAQGGTTTATTQQYSLLVHDQDSTKAPMAAFWRDLKAFLHQCRQRGDELILVGDLTEEVGENADGMVRVVQDLDMIDLMGARHNVGLPVTYSRGRKCLDYGFATARVCAALTACGYESFGHWFPSDHRAYFFDFDTRRLLGTQIQPLSKFEPRQLYSTNAKQVTCYLRKMHSIMLSCNAYA